MEANSFTLMSLLNDNIKTQLIMAGASAGVSLFKKKMGISDSNEGDFDDGDIDVDALLIKVKEYEKQINNILSGADLGNKFTGTDTAFNSIIKVIMFNLEDDYREVIENFNSAIDNEEFIRSHEAAMELRQKRLDAEYEAAMQQYKIELKEYEAQEAERANSGLFKRMLSKKENPPVKPKRRM